ncbi:MAG TPA: DNA-directed RNA polymerase subunit beta [Dehalococcoidia bacterium]|nr:DNA-directed RNA polymerase subunit beta [Dehalococcoidia bacterium]
MLKHKLLKSFAKLPETLEIPDLIHVQLDSFRWFQEEGLRELFEEISPIQDYTNTRLELHFVDYEFREPQHSISECLERGLTYSSPIHVTAQLVVKETGEIKQQELYFSDFPLMTDAGTFIISGVERVVVNQLTRFPGVYFTLNRDSSSGRELCFAKLVAEHGAWLDFDTSNRDVISVKVSGKRKIPITTLLRVIGFESDEALLSLFQDVDNSPEHAFLRSTIERDPLIKSKADALFDIYRKLSSGEAPSLSSAQALLNNFLFNPRRYSLGKVGRYKLNKKLGLDIPGNCTGLTPEDLVQIVRRIISVNIGKETPDDIDHLGNRRAQAVGFLIQKQFRIGLLRLERAIKERMSILGPEAATPAALINIRPVAVAIREFFGRSQLSQFMDQTNPLAELTHKRRLSAMGPGGLSRKQAGFEVRDVHHSHYGRICPIETPEGPNIGLIGSLATYASVNGYGFIETPYLRVIHEVPNTAEELTGRTIGEDIDSEGKLVAKVGTLITKKLAQSLSSLPARNIKVNPFVSSQIAYLTADEEDQYAIAQANALLNKRNEFVYDKVEVKRGNRYFKESIDGVNFIDVSPKQLFGIAACLIPFLEHDDANRALMGCNMQRQAVPLLRPECPLVATGMEREVAKYSGQVIFAPDDAVVTSATSSRIVIKNGGGEEQSFDLIKFARTNQGTCINQHPIVNKGDKVKRGQVLVDSFSLDGGNLALGQNVICAFMSWEGYNFEDAIVISRRLVKDDAYTSVHIEKYEIEERDTKLGPEEITRDIPNVNEESLANLDEIGIVHIGAEVKPNDILVGKITPKGETEPSAEEKLLRAIFGEKTREVKDSSLRMPSGEWGRVIRTKVFSRDNHDELPAGVNNLIQVWVAQKRKISVGDKMSGRHGNKGVISIILPEEDMPFLPDGTPVDIILNPLGVPSRMNIGQVFEAHLGWAAQTLGFQAINPIFDGADALTIEDALAKAWIAWKAGAVNFSPEDPGSARTDLEKVGEWLSRHGFDAKEIMDEEHKGVARKASLCLWLEELGIADSHQLRALGDEDLEQIVQKVYKERKLYPPIFGKMELRDGRTGELFDKPVTVGNIYIMKLIHLVGDKVHARSTGPYSLITQQPLGGKAQFGGQRFGEMEVWALEGYGAAHTLQEMLTIKSDDVMGRAKAYESLVKGEDIQQLGIPESTKVLFMELRSLGFAVELLSEGENVSI